MNPILLYMVKAGLSLATLYFVYRLFLDRDTMYERNRFFILLSFISSFLFPLIIIQTRQPNGLQFFGGELSGVTVNDAGNGIQLTGIEAFIASAPLLLKIYLSGVAVLSMKFLAEILGLLFLIASRKNGRDNIIQIKNPFSAGFAAFGYIFIDPGLSINEAKEIIRHEQKHLESYHFFDILFIELIKIFQWFNPFVYLFDRSLREVHEFQADEECLSSGIPVENYRGIMLNQVFRTSVFNASSSFSNPTLIKKRMIMMTRKRSRNLANLKVLLVLPVAGLLLLIFSTCSEKMQLNSTPPGIISPPSTVQTPFAGQENVKIVQETMMNGEAEPFVVVEEMPMFPGGDAELLKYIATNTKYPLEAKEKGIQGRVIVRFAIMADGSVSKVTVLKSVDPSLDAEAIRVVSSLPAFLPGKQGGKSVPVWYMVPITFALGESKGQTLMPPPTGQSQTPPPPPPPTGQGNAEIINVPAKNGGAETFTMVEEMPKFPGGDLALLKFISDNTKYPPDAKAKGIQGRVIVRLCIGVDGSLSNLTVLKSVDPELDKEALRVVSSLPAFQPGKQGGKPVPVWYMIPITFTLK